jgi:adenosylhomocysteine nucleosidase
MIGIIGAMDIEVNNLKEKIENKQTKTISGIEFVWGTIYNKEVVVAKCGIGKVFASICAQTMILNFNPEYIINTGVAGTLTTELSLCDIAISEQVVQHDMDTSPLGDPVGLISGINKIYFEADKKLINLAQSVIKEQKFNFKTGVIASGDQFIATKEQKANIVTNFNAIACEMEGAPIGHTAYVNNVGFIVIRAISDSADDTSSMDYPTFLKMAAENSFKITLELINRI